MRSDDYELVRPHSRPGMIVAQLPVEVTQEAASDPAITACRHAALEIRTGGYVVYDRLLNRIVDGVYAAVEDALAAAAHLNGRGSGEVRCAPNGKALGLTYPNTDDDERG